MAKPLKDIFFQKSFFDSLAARIGKVHPAFDQRRFRRLVMDEGWQQRALKARMRHAAEVLGQTLPASFPEALGILMKVEGNYEGLDHLLFADFVERFGSDHFDESMDALEVLTRTTAEFAVRPFIIRYPKKAMARMGKWSRHRDEQVRRLSSEGCRPRLPWGMGLPALKIDPGPILPILKRLRNDPSESVRRSVANNLNDIAKDHPERVLDLAERWLQEVPDTRKLLKHALRGLLKQGNQRALDLFGVGDEAAVAVKGLRVAPKTISIGGSATLHLELRSLGSSDQVLRLEYEIDYLRPSGHRSRKVFQIRQVTLAAQGALELSRKLSFKDLSTRKHHPGKHTLTLVVNGRRAQRATFVLTWGECSSAPERHDGSRFHANHSG